MDVSPNKNERQLTPICTGFLENMDNSWYCYFLTDFTMIIKENFQGGK